MQKLRCQILSNEPLLADVYRLRLQTGLRNIGGEFVNLAIPDYYLRRPLSIHDEGDGWISLIYKCVGEGTRRLATLPEGSSLEVLAGLGRGFDTAACRQKALLVGGGLGTPPLHLLAKRLHSEGRQVTAILGFNKKEECVLADGFDRYCEQVILSTADGSAGIRGFVTDAIRAEAPACDYFYTCGPMIMMKKVCQLLEGPGEASLEERMGCGAGFCYGCSIQTTEGPRRVCADGPVFKKEVILW